MIFATGGRVPTIVPDVRVFVDSEESLKRLSDLVHVGQLFFISLVSLAYVAATAQLVPWQSQVK